MKRHAIAWILMGSLGTGGLLPLAGCEQAKENPRTSGAVIGGAGGAAAGAALSKDNRLLGALLGGALGAGGGYLIGTQVAKNDSSHKDEAVQASQTAQATPATAADVSKSDTADLNHDGFVTMDEVVAMKQAGLSDNEQIRRLRTTGQVFGLTPDQQQHLRNQGISQQVIDAMDTMNRDTTPTTNPVIGSERISQPHD